MGEVEVAQADRQSAREEAEALVRGLRERSAEACAELYDRYGLGIHRFAVTRLGDMQAAEDVVVETMAWVVRDIGRFNPRRSSLSAWVYGIARRRVLLEIRRRKRRKSVPAEAQVSMASVGDVSDGRDLAEGSARRLDARRTVAELHEVLSEVEFDTLVLSCVEGLSAREVGQVIRRSERAVHSILHRAKKKARERSVGDE
jgi:RNA polymerase sigma factor (sigma-70 family)